MSELLHPKRVTVKDVFGGEREYIISLMPATVAIDFQALAPAGFMAKAKDIAAVHELRDMLFKHIAVETEDGREIRLTTSALIDNHVTGGVQATALVAQMVEYNFNFFGSAGSPGFLDFLLQKFARSIMPMLTPWLDRLSALDLPGTPNSKP